MSVFAVSPHGLEHRIAMIDDHYGRDIREHAVSLLDALAIGRAVDAGWTPQRRRRLLAEAAEFDVARCSS